MDENDEEKKMIQQKMDDERRLGLSQLCILIDGMRDTHDYMSSMSSLNQQKKLKNSRIFKEFNNDNIPINLKELNLLGSMRADQMLIEMLDEDGMDDEVNGNNVDEAEESEESEMEERYWDEAPYMDELLTFI